jgi:hypothetical protein
MQVKKPLIGVLASHDSLEKNRDLAELFVRLYHKDPARLEKFHFVFTGGTFDRVVLGTTPVGTPPQYVPIQDSAVRDFVKRNSTRLPTFIEGGVTILANLVVQRQCYIVWPFLSPVTTHWLNPENLALMRLIDIWKDKRSMTPGSVETGFSIKPMPTLEEPLKISLLRYAPSLTLLPQFLPELPPIQRDITK